MEMDLKSNQAILHYMDSEYKYLHTPVSYIHWIWVLRSMEYVFADIDTPKSFGLQVIHAERLTLRLLAITSILHSRDE